jgi:hypothetical protein
MSGPRKTLDELIAKALERQERSRADVADLRTRAMILKRKRDNHRKTFAGAHLLVRVKANPRLRRAVQEDFNQSVTNPKNRAVIPDLLDERAFQQAMAANRAAIEAKEEAAAMVGQTQPGPPMRPLKAPGETPSGAAPS